MVPRNGFGRAGRGAIRTPLAAMMAAVMLLALFVGSVSAHTPNVSLTCENGLKVDLTYYSTKSGNPTPNTVQVWIDGVEVSGSTFHFGASFKQTWSVDKTAAHTAKVVVVAWDGANNPAWSPTYNLSSKACVTPTPTPTTVPTPTPTTVPTPTPTTVPTPTPTTVPTPTPTTVPTPTPTTVPTPTPTTVPTPTPTTVPTPTPTATPPEFEETPTPTVPPTSTPTADPTPSGTAEGATGTPRVTPPSTDGLGTDAGSSGPGSGLALVLILLGGASLALLPLATRRSRR
jgi:hypothetical protein